MGCLLWVFAALAQQPTAEPTTTTIAPLAEEDSGGMAPEAWRIGPIGGRSGLSLREHAVVGGEGGVSVTTAALRVTIDDFSTDIEMPVAAYATPAGRTTDVGNLTLRGMYRLRGDRWEHGIGGEVHFSVGDPAWTWASRSEELWPGGGFNALWRSRYVSGETTVLTELSGGAHGAIPYGPFPRAYARVGAAVAVDQTVVGPLGVSGELAASWWDVSPLDITGLTRVDLLEGLRARGGVVLPIGEWAALAPDVDEPGLRDIAVVFDLVMAP